MKRRLQRLLYNLLNPNAEKLRRLEDQLFAPIFENTTGSCVLIGYNSPEMWGAVRQSRARQYLHGTHITWHN